MDDYYNLFQEIRKTKIDGKQIRKDYGSRGSFILNMCCPIVVKNGGTPLDELADELGFSSADELYEYIKDYKPKYKFLQEMEDYYGSPEET